MNDLKNIKYWLFDLDNTLYDGATKVFEQVDKKMTKFISEKLNVDIDKTISSLQAYKKNKPKKILELIFDDKTKIKK